MGISETALNRVKPSLKPYRIPDSRGLYLLVTPSGGRLWRWNFRFQGAQKTMSFGQWPDVPLELARDRHQAARKLLASGIDPMAQRKAARKAAANSFEVVAKLWLDHWRAGKNPRHAGMTQRRLERNVYPLLGSRPIDAIQAPELIAMVKAIEDRRVRDLPRRALETTGQIFRYAIAHGYATRNPCADIKPADVLRPTVTSNLARVSARELPALLRAIEDYPSVVTRLALKLLALTFVRTSELLGARWEEFDIEGRRWDLPASRMKMGSPHTVPLSRQALEVLESLRLITGQGELLFPRRWDTSQSYPVSNMIFLMALRRMGYGGVMTGHGFRGIASTLLHENGFPHEHIEIQLAHSKRDSVSAAYNHALYLQPRTEMLQWYADYLERAERGATVAAVNTVTA